MLKYYVEQVTFLISVQYNMRVEGIQDQSVSLRKELDIV